VQPSSNRAVKAMEHDASCVLECTRSTQHAYQKLNILHDASCVSQLCSRVAHKNMQVAACATLLFCCGIHMYVLAKFGFTCFVSVHYTIVIATTTSAMHTRVCCLSCWDNFSAGTAAALV
jgi:hypothetical protein